MKTELSDDLVKIRFYQPEDIPLLFEAVRGSVAEMSDWMPWCHREYSLKERADFIMSREAALNEKLSTSPFSLFERINFSAVLG